MDFRLLGHPTVSATWSVSDRPVSPYNSVTEARIEAPQAPEDRAR